MKRLLLAGALALFSLPVFAANLGYQQSTSLSTSSAINLPTIPSGAGRAIISAENSGIRWRDDSTDPTSSVGMPISAGQTMCYDGDLNRIRIIGQAAGATLDVAYYVGKCGQ